ncbi:MAG: toxin TcdB middle/C-terminal domain-containing protein [Polyangiaceae bacterium]
MERSSSFAFRAFARKPLLLESIDNRRGKLVRLEHATSTKFYLADQRAGLDGTTAAAIPYSVTETSYEVRKLQSRRRPVRNVPFALAGFATLERLEIPAIMHLIPRETRAFAYDRVQDDPRVSQTLALAVDAYGTVTQSASLAYPRRSVPTALPEQGVLHCAVAESVVLHMDTEQSSYRLSVPLESKSYELTGLTATGMLTLEDVATAYAAATEIAYHEAPSTGVEKRLVQREKVRYYDSSSMPDLLGFGQADFRALPYKSYLLDLTDDLIELAFDTRVGSTELTAGGYVTLPDEDGYWLPSGHATFDRDNFCLPTSFTDAFENTTTVTYDAYSLFTTEVTDPLGNSVSAVIDYRVLGPKEITDANGNRSAARFDDLGLVTATAIMGKVGSTDGDTLESPTTYFEYDLFQWVNHQKPNFAHSYARETHGDSGTRWLETVTYTDGSGRAAMVKTLAEPDASSAPRWVGSGRTVLNNKGNPIKQYEPYFSETSDYEDEDEIVATGVTPILTYDPIGRLTRTDLPNGSYSRVEISPWQSRSFDPNDTILEDGNLWRAARLSTATPTPTAAEQRARELTEAHANTPTTTHLDSMGRAFLVVVDNGNSELFETRTKLDIESQVLEVKDPLGRTCQSHLFSMAGQLLKETNIDKGSRWALRDVTGAPIRRWDARDQRFRTELDALRRTTHLWLKVGTADEVLLQRFAYGDDAGLTSPADDNLRGRLIRTFDGAGVVRATSFDFKGNLLASERQLATTYDATVDWSALATDTTVTALESHAASSLETEVFTETRAYDALNRPTSVITPDSSEVLPTYNEAGLLESVAVKVRGATTATGVVTGIDYDAQGRRTEIAYANGTSTAYEYDELTFRLRHAVSTRTSPAATLQDLSYTYDPVGNILAIADAAQQTIFYNNTVTSGSTLYEYEASYRLKWAKGREHAGAGGDDHRDNNDLPVRSLPMRTTPPRSSPTKRTTLTISSATSSPYSTPEWAAPRAPGPALTPMSRGPTA